jgi:dTDP-glucose pyrophosphorylase
MIPLTDAIFVGEHSSVKDAIEAVENGRYGVALWVDDQRRLLGLLTDSDLRKALLRGASLSDRVAPYVNRSPVVAMAEQPREEIFELMRRTGCSPVPLLDPSGAVVGLESLTSLLRPGGLADHLVVIMAGGLGARLHPLTLDRPKPMLPVSGKPILHLILESLKAYGFRRVFIAVHFRHELIEEYFGDGKHLGLQIEYLREETPLGTAGALALLPERPSQPFVVMNGDLLTHVNMESLVDYHVRSGLPATMCVRAYEVQIPYGVARLEGPRVVSLEEKPVHGCFVNAGIYVLNPEMLELVGAAPRPLDMTDLMAKAIDRWGGINSFPIHEYWMDVGHFDEYEQASNHYQPRRLGAP